MQIENSQYNQKIEERNQELLELKKTTGRTIQALNAAKQVWSFLEMEYGLESFRALFASDHNFYVLDDASFRESGFRINLIASTMSPSTCSVHPPKRPLQELSDLLAETDSLQSGTGERDDVIVKLADELDRVTIEHDAAKRANSKLNRQQASADMPQVLDYVNQARYHRMTAADQYPNMPVVIHGSLLSHQTSPTFDDTHNTLCRIECQRGFSSIS